MAIFIRKKTIEFAVLIFIITIFTDFFEFRPLTKIFSYLKYITIVPLTLFCLQTILKDKSLFANPLRLIFVSILISFIPAYISWEQSPLAGFISAIPYMGFVIYFYLVKTQISIQKVEQLLYTFCMLYLVFYFFQFLNPSTVYFGSWSSLGETRGILRIIFSGEGFLFWGIAYYFNNILNRHKTRSSFLILILLCTVMFMQVTRQYILSVGIVFTIGILRNSNIYLKTLAILLILSASYIYQYSSHSMIVGMKEHIESDMELKDEYIRVVASKYFLTEMSPNGLSSFMGNGVPHPNSDYGHFYYEELVKERGYYFEDVGLIGAYALFGILFIVGYLIIGYLLLKVKIPSSGNYLKYYIIIILIMSLSSRSVFGPGFVVPTVMILYLLQKYHEIGSVLKSENNSN